MSSAPSSPLPEPPVARRIGTNRSFASGRAIMALILREMATRYGRSPGGYIWALAEPVAMIIVIAVAFAALVRTPPLGDNFILFFATGILPFQLYGKISETGARAIKFSRSLLFYPAVTWIDAVLARGILTILTDVLVMLILFFIFLALFDTAVFITIGPILIALGLAILLGLGVGMVNCVLFNFYPAWANLWAIANRPLFFVSGILFLYEDMPAHLQAYLWYNPLIHVSALMRSGFYNTYDAAFASPLYVMCIAVPLICLGLLLMGRFHRQILNN